MSIAEIYGKLSPDNPRGAHEGMEDLLTSDVFGTMLYVGWQPVFHAWMSEAQCAPSLSPGSSFAQYLPASEDIRNVAYSFWPRLPNNREPDVALLIECADQSTSLIVVEAKYRSGLSGEKQLIDEAQGLFDLTPSQLGRWRFRPPIRPLHSASLRKVLLYVTQDSSLPATDLIREGNTAWPIPAFWLSWKSLSRHLESERNSSSSSSLLLEDLRELLKRKKLRDFVGFDQAPLNDLPPAGFYSDTRSQKFRGRGR
jgi:hypothetical protein